MERTAWIIEPNPQHGASRYLRYAADVQRFVFGTSIEQAIQFSRREDAESMLNFLRLGPQYGAIEHIWQ